MEKVKVSLGVSEEVKVEYKGEFSYLSTTGENVNEITKKICLKEKAEAPVKKGDVMGTAEYYLGETKVGSVDIVAAEEVRKIVFFDCIKKLVNALWI